MENWAVIHKIKEGLEKGESVSELARRLGVDRKTVRKYRDLSEGEIRRVRRQPRRHGQTLGGFLDWLKARVAEYEEQGVVNSECIYRELVAMGYEGSPRTLRRAVSQMRTRPRKRIHEPFETPAGHQAMVDLGQAKVLSVRDRKIAVYFVAMVLSYSRKKYGEWFDRPITTETFLSVHERAFKVLGGVAAEIVYDQTKLAVLREHYGECEFNEDFYGFARFYGFDPYICHRYDPQSKGKVEAVVRYAKRGFLPGRKFADIWDVQRQWDEWVESVANHKAHEVTGKAPNELWLEERGHLKPLPEGSYDVQPSMERRTALGNGLVKVLGNAYSVPQKHHGKEIYVQVTEEKIHFYDLLRQHIWTHWRGSERGKRFIEKSHYEREYSTPTEAFEREVVEIFQSPAMLKALKARFPRHYREQMKGLIRLDRDHTREVLREASQRAVTFGCVSLGNIEKIIHGVQAGKKSIPLTRPNEGKALGVKSAQMREMSYYGRAAQQKQEEQDEGWLL